MWITFYADAGFVVLATLAAVVVALIWFATVDADRLVDERGRPNLFLFGLAGLGMALLVTASALLVTATTLLTALIGVTAVATGVVRAIRAGLVER